MLATSQRNRHVLLGPIMRLSKDSRHSNRIDSNNPSKNLNKKSPRKFLLPLAAIVILVIVLCVLVFNGFKSRAVAPVSQKYQLNSQTTPASTGSNEDNSLTPVDGTSGSASSNSSSVNLSVNGQQIDVPANGTYSSSTNNGSGQSNVNVSSSHSSSSAGTSVSNNSNVNINVNDSSN